jgi:hypothetical protein
LSLLYKRLSAAKGYFPRLPWGIFVRINNNNFWFTELHRRRDELQKQLAKKREHNKHDDRCHWFFHKLLTSLAGRGYQNAAYLIKNTIACANARTDYRSTAYPDGRAFGGIWRRGVVFGCSSAYLQRDIRASCQRVAALGIHPLLRSPVLFFANIAALR